MSVAAALGRVHTHKHTHTGRTLATRYTILSSIGLRASVSGRVRSAPRPYAATQTETESESASATATATETGRRAELGRGAGGATSFRGGAPAWTTRPHPRPLLPQIDALLQDTHQSADRVYAPSPNPTHSVYSLHQHTLTRSSIFKKHLRK